MEKNVAIVHYNTPELIEAAIISLWKCTPDARVTVFDNSDKRPFVPMEGVSVIDNTHGQCVNFAEMLARYPKKIPTSCNWGSEKHIASVDYLLDILTEGFVLADSDVLFKRDISPLFDVRFAWVGTIEREPPFWFQAARCLPFLLWLNVPKMKSRGVRFFHEEMVYKMSHLGAPPYYDTGGSLYVDCNIAGLPFREINIYDYIEHLGGGSCYPCKWEEWLDKNRVLYE